MKIFNKQIDITHLISIALLFLFIALAFTCSLKTKLNIDEYEHIHATWKISVGEKIYTEFFENHHPLLYYLSAPLIILSGDKIRTIFVLRIFMFLMFLAILYYSYKISHLIFNFEASIFTIFLLSATPTFIARVIEYRPDVPMTLTALASIYYLFHYLKTWKPASLILSSITLSLSFLFLQKAIFLVLFLHLILLYKLMRKKITYKTLLLFSSIFTIIILPYYLNLILSHSLKIYFFNCWTFNKAWLARHHLSDFTLTFITKLFKSYLNPFNSLFHAFFYTTGLGLILFTKTKKEDKIIIGFLSLALLLSVETSNKLWPQYYMIFIPVMIAISSYAFSKTIKKKCLKITLLILFLIYPGFALTKIWRTRPIKKELKRIAYVLENTDPSQCVYDGYDLGNNSRFNLFRKDIDYFWWSLHPWEALPLYIKMTNYYYDVYQRIEEKKPELIRNYLIDVNYPFIRKCYAQVSDKYPRYYFIKLHRLENKIILQYWHKSYHKNTLPLIKLISPFSLSSTEVINVANSLYSQGHLTVALKWYKASLVQNPINKDAIKKLISLHRKFHNKKRVDELLKMLKKADTYIIRKADFEHGWRLEAISLSPDASNSRILKVKMILGLRQQDRLHTAFISFYKNGNFYFARDFNLINAKPFGELYSLNSSIYVPLSIPKGRYRTYFTFRLIKSGYMYHLVHNFRLSDKNKIFIKEINIK